MKLPNMISPAAPSPSPPKNSILGGPHSNTFPVLHSIGSLFSPSSDPKIPQVPIPCSNFDRRSLTPDIAFLPLLNAFSNMVDCSSSDFGGFDPLFNSYFSTVGQFPDPPGFPGSTHFKTLPAILKALFA